jgi:selenide, water dikinase
LLDSVLKRLPRPTDPNLLVGFETSDDAGVYRLTDKIALVQTVDILTPIADEPLMFGQIAAANSLSDVYAMGGRPVSALSVVGFPDSRDAEILEEILRGGLQKMVEASCTIVGGHSIRDEELKFGYAVTGVIDPSRIWRNVGARSGDVLILTKPLGTGVISTALKQGRAESAWVDAATASMARLNRDAAEALREAEGGNGEAEATAADQDRTAETQRAQRKAAAGKDSAVHAVTDITGFGLLGHAREMAAGSGVSMRIEHERIEYLPGAVEAARAKFFSGGLKSNREFLEGCVEFAASVTEEFRALLFDPQTSGGLFAAVAPEAADAAMAALERRDVAATVVGEVMAKRSPLIEID